MSDAKEGEGMAKAWLAGKSELIDDLAVLVAGMDRPLDAIARAFLLTIGNAAKASAKREARPTPSARRTPDPAKAQPSPEAPRAPQPPPQAAPAAPARPAFEGLGDAGFAERYAELAARNASLWGR
jgi:hypothetical protein